MLLVYVAGPLTKGDMMANIRKACEEGTSLMKNNISVHIPHASAFVEMIAPVSVFGDRSYEMWMKADIEILSRCDAMYRIPGESSGADREEKFANENGIPVFHRMYELLAWANRQ